MIIENTYTLEELYKAYGNKGTTFVIEDGKITRVEYVSRTNKSRRISTRI